MSKSQTIWLAVSGLIERLTVLIREGALVRGDQGIEYIQKTLTEEFKVQIEASGKRLTKASILRKLSEVIWTPEIKKLLEEVVRNHKPIDEFLKHCPFIPRNIAAREYKHLAGTSSRQHPEMFHAGFGRIASAMQDTDFGSFQLPENSFSKPFEIDFADGKSVAIPNGINLGIPYGGLIKDNPARRALEDAECRGDAAVILTNFLDIDVHKAGGVASVFRALASGRNVSVENLVDSYRTKARFILDQRPVGGIVYQTTEEMFLDSLGGWAKIATTPKGTPEFSGPIFIVLGYKEQEFIAAAAYWEANYWTIKNQHDLDVEISLAKRALAVALEGGGEKDIAKARQALEEFLNERARTIMSNIQPEEWQRYYRQVFAYFVKKLEKTIPHSKVIGIGITYIKLHDKIVEIYIPSHTRVTDKLLANYTKSYGPKVLRSTMADVVVICHPYSLNFRSTVRENDKKGKRGSSEVVTAPITVDEDYLRGVFDDTVRALHPIVKVVKNEQFSAGMLRLEYINDTLHPVCFSIPSLGKKSNGKSNGKACSATARYDTKFIWIMVSTDPHFGSPTRERFQIADGRYVGSTEAAIEMIRRAGLCQGDGLPIHMFVMNDDPTQGHHFPIEQQPHPKKVSYKVIEEYAMRQLDAAKAAQNAKDVQAILQNFTKVALEQFLLQGEIWTQSQMLWLIEELFEGNLDFFSGVLLRGLKADLRIRGGSEFAPTTEDFAHDTRDIGLINIGTGNHFQKSVNGELTEGVIYVKMLQALLRTLPPWNNQGALLDRLVCAPLYGDLFVGYGAVQTPDGYPWVFDLRSTPAKMQGWEDPLMGWVSIDLRRGNYSRIMDIGKTIKICGDKHFFATVNTSYALYHMSGPDTATDKFAEWAGGFPPNNTGVSFVGLPVDGPNSGPIIVRTLRYDRIRDYFEGKDNNFDWEAFLPNPA